MASTDAPAALALTQTPPSGGGRPVSDRPLQVLVVDNNRLNRCSTKTMLESCGYQATAVQTAKQGIKLLEAAPEAFDLILKQHDPKHRIDAARLMSHLRSSNFTNLRSLPVAVTSTCDGCEAVLQCFRMGATDYLIHPLRINELLVLGTSICHSKQAICPSVLYAAQEPADWSCTSADTEIHEEDDEPEAEAHQAAQSDGIVARAGSAPDSVPAQNLCNVQASANWNSVTKGAVGCLVANDGSSAANRHGSKIVAHGSNIRAVGSNTGNGDSTTQRGHMYMRRLPDAAVPLSLRPPTTAGGSGSGYRTGSGNSRDDGGANGSGQGSGSGNEDLARTQQRAPESLQLWAQQGVAVAATTAAHDGDSSGKCKANAAKGRGSNGNSGVGAAEGDAVAAAKRQTHAASMRGTAPGKLKVPIVPGPEAPATAAPTSQQPGSGGGQSPRASGESQQAALPESGKQRNSLPAGGTLPQPACTSPVGFRAWVRRPHQPAYQDAPKPARQHCGLKRKAGSASFWDASLPMASSCRVAGETAVAANSGALEPFGSTGTGESCGTCAQLGSSGLPCGSSMRQGSALRPTSAAACAATSQPSVALPPPPPLLVEHHPKLYPQGKAQPSSIFDPGSSSTPQLAKQHDSQGNGHHHYHHRAQLRPVPQPRRVPTVSSGGAAAWDSTDGASAQTFQQLQQMNAAAAAQQQQVANQQQSRGHQEQQGTAQQQFQQAQMNAQMHGGYDSNFQCGMPPHMVPHSFAPTPFSVWGTNAAAAQQAGMQQQQVLAFAQQMHQQGQDLGPAQLQAQMQHAHVQQMMMAGYPAFLLGGQFGLMWYTCAQGGGLAGPMPGGFGNFQAGWAQAQQQQQEQLQQTAIPPTSMGGGSQAPQQRHRTPAASPFANCSQAAGAPGHSGVVPPSAVVGDSEVGDAVNGTSTVAPPGACTDLTRQPSPRECRAQALTKYKQKRKNLCFTKKIRYENRKQLAQARPRLRGQFVRVDDAGAGAAVEVLDGSSALAAAVAAGTARLVPEEEATAAGLSSAAGASLAAVPTVEDDGAESDASDVASPRAAPAQEFQHAANGGAAVAAS